MIDLPKGKRTTIRVRRREFEGCEFIDVRQWFVDAAGNLKPTGKGVSIPPEMAQDLARAIEQVSAQEQADD